MNESQGNYEGQSSYWCIVSRIIRSRHNRYEDWVSAHRLCFSTFCLCFDKLLSSSKIATLSFSFCAFNVRTVSSSWETSCSFSLLPSSLIFFNRNSYDQSDWISQCTMSMWTSFRLQIHKTQSTSHPVNQRGPFTGSPKVYPSRYATAKTRAKTWDEWYLLHGIWDDWMLVVVTKTPGSRSTRVVLLPNFSHDSILFAHDTSSN